MTDQEQYVNEAIEDGVITIEDTFPMVPEPLVVPSNIDALISQHMLNIFNRYRDTNIPGSIQMKVTADAHASAREIAIKFEVAVGPWDCKQEFISPSLDLSFRRSVERYHDQTAHAILALPAS